MKKQNSLKPVGKAVVQKPLGFRIRRNIKNSWPLWLMILPALIHLIIFSYVPMYGVQIAFKDFRPSKGIWGSEWVGLKHFIHFVQYPKFLTMFWNTLKINLIQLLFWPCRIIFALMLNEVANVKFKKTVQMVTYLPHFLTEVIVCSMITLFLNKDAGAIPALLNFFGMEKPNLLGSVAAFPWVYVISGLWQGLGWSSILYISALSGIDPEQIEAARIDGASRFQVMRYINIPGIAPTIIITFIMQIGSLLGVGWSKIYLLRNDMNYDAAQVISVYTYEIGLISGQFSYSAAIGMFNNLVNIILLVIANTISKKVSETSFF